MFTVYALVDPRNDDVRYIGITDDVYKRFFQHIQCNGNNIDKNEWIQSLRDQNVMLIMRTVEVVATVEEAREREQHWIHYYLSQGLRLLNIDISRSFSYENFQSFFGERRAKASDGTNSPVDNDISTRRRPLTTAEAVTVMGVTEKTVREWKKTGKLSVSTDGKGITASSVRRMLESRKEKVS